LGFPDTHTFVRGKTRWEAGVSYRESERQIAEEAVDWVDSLAKDYSLENQARFVTWLRASAAHFAAFLFASATKMEKSK